MIKSTFFFPFLFLFSGIYAAEKNSELAVSKINPVLLENANAVIRQYDERMEVLSLHEISYTLKYTITLLNKDAREYSIVDEAYDKLFDEVDAISGTLFDKDGKEIKKLKKIDIVDAAPYLDAISFNDYRVKSFSFNYSNYPYTVTFEIKKTFKESCNLPSFSPQRDKQTSVEKASMTLLYPKDFPLRYKTFHLTVAPVFTLSDGSKNLSIIISNIKAEKNTDMEPEDIYSLPTAIFVTDTFEFGGLSGKMDTWQSFGKFQYDLNADRRALTHDAKLTVHRLTDTCKGRFSKIDVLYKYLQQNTRYVAVEQGIGGWQCLEATFVCTNKYADCKGLANYMSALLLEAGINSYGVLIYGGDDHKLKLLRDFPADAFNHYILCVPINADTVWLDCTSKTATTGYLEPFTSDRDALMLTPEGGFVIHSPAYSLNENYLLRKVNIHISGPDSSSTHLQLMYAGYFHDLETPIILHSSEKEITDHFTQKFPLMGDKVVNYHTRQGLAGRVPILEEDITMSGKSKLTHSGNRTFIDPAISLFNQVIPGDNSNRTVPFEIMETCAIADTETINLDNAYTAEFIPEAISVNYPFASYHFQILFEDAHTLKIFTIYNRLKGIYPASDFTDYIALMKSLNAAHKRIVLIKKE